MRMYFLRYAFIVNLISIIKAVEFSHNPQDHVVIEGTTVKLTCVLEEVVSDRSLSWLRNRQKITEGRNILESSQLLYRDVITNISPLSGKSTFYELEIRSVLYSDSGKYACAVDRNGIEVKSEAADLTVNQLPDPIYPICDPIGNPISEGNRVKLKCTGDIIDPPIKLRLSKYMTDIKTDTEVLLYQQTTPIMHSIIANASDNNAIFTCQLTTPANQSIIRNCSFGPLNVWYKPNITIQHAATTLSGREAIFICQTNANPPVTDFMWQFYPPLSIDRYDVDDIGQVMRILRVTIDDNGLIVKCTARNTVGRVAYHVTIKVIDTDNGSINKPKTNAIESTNNKQSKKKSISLSVLLAVVSVLVLVIVFAIIIPVYYFCICSKKEENVVGQPDVYFEPQDRLTLPLPNKRHSVLWRRSFGAQVPTDRDVDAMYLEIQSDHYIFTPDSRCNTLP
ncbi:leucine-rich repeats and immunoglobulin-like domains protein 2 [Anneissia japonica]|uniref:leucine-rich repeats and immunoglobulin-like domains protein 2 n=1 Tax=Anneissia japonica TaxID=1529436 RepID=UPI0014257B8F|nr:leucine-rich repeats and immunoglobulin-like domains protein 2 [Anneissia japonica]